MSKVSTRFLTLWTKSRIFSCIIQYHVLYAMISHSSWQRCLSFAGYALHKQWTRAARYTSGDGRPFSTPRKRSSYQPCIFFSGTKRSSLSRDVCPSDTSPAAPIMHTSAWLKRMSSSIFGLDLKPGMQWSERLFRYKSNSAIDITSLLCR
jgi:hypothetical protein